MQTNSSAVLIVDDIVVNRMMLKRLVESLELNPVLAENGQEALDMMQVEKFDLVLLDIMMPGIDGVQVLEQIRADEKLRDIPAIMISAITAMEKIIECIKLGAVDYIIKPFDAKLVRSRIWRHVQNSLGFRKGTASHNNTKDKPEILIVDDDATNLKILSKHLSALVYHPLTVETGQTALSVLDKQSADLILLDIMMPGMDGIEVLNRIKANENTKDIPVVMVSALDDFNTIKKCLEAGAEDYIIKPFNMVLLSSRVESCVANKQPAA